MKRTLFAAAMLFGLTVLARAEVCSAIANDALSVDSRNDEWTAAPLKVQPGDLILVMARGKVHIGGVLGDVTAKGAPNGNGRLEMKIGAGTVVPVGDRWVGAFREPGSIKFRVANVNPRGGMSGSHDVRLIVIPAGTLPQAVKVDAE